MDVAEPTGRGIAKAAGAAEKSSSVASTSGNYHVGVRLYAAARALLTFSRRHSSGSRFSAAIASQRHSSRTRFSSSLDAAITTLHCPRPFRRRHLKRGRKCLHLTFSGWACPARLVCRLCLGVEVMSCSKKIPSLPYLGPSLLLSLRASKPFRTRSFGMMPRCNASFAHSFPPAQNSSATLISV